MLQTRDQASIGRVTPHLRGVLPVARARRPSGHDRELAQLVEPDLARLVQVAEKILGSGAEAEDAVQDALIALWRLKDTPPNLRGWLRRTVVHRSLHARRTAQRRKKWEERAGVDWALQCPLCDPQEEATGAQLKRQLDHALEALSDQQRIVVALRAEGLEYDEIASKLGVPVGTVRHAKRWLL